MGSLLRPLPSPSAWFSWPFLMLPSSPAYPTTALIPSPCLHNSVCGDDEAHEQTLIGTGKVCFSSGGWPCPAGWPDSSSWLTSEWLMASSEKVASCWVSPHLPAMWGVGLHKELTLLGRWKPACQAWPPLPGPSHKLLTTFLMISSFPSCLCTLSRW